jgi:hypothetical protein
MAEREVRIQPPQMFLIQLLVILAQWAFGAWLLPVLRHPSCQVGPVITQVAQI